MNVNRPAEEIALLVADVFELAGLFRRNGERLASTVGQTQARWQLLSVIAHGDWTVSAAARRLGVTRQAVQPVADALAAEGLLEMVHNPAHRRAPLLRLTADGEATLTALTTHSLHWNKALADQLTSTEIADSRRLIGKLIDHLTEHRQAAPSH